MAHIEKIFIREDKSKVKISVELLFLSSRDNPEYRVHVYKCLPNKRKFILAAETNSYDYRVLSMKDRAESELNQYLQYATKEEIYQTKLSLWESIKPKID